MARHKTILTEPDSEPQLDISSLIDVCFLLLIYFLVTSTIGPRERDLPLKLPPEKWAGTSSPIQPMFIRVDAAGAIFTGTGLGERPMDNDPRSRDLPLLANYLNLYHSAAISAGEKPLVQIWVDPGVTQQRVIDVLNALAAAGIDRVTFTDLLENT
jgi:biopolymer transport protein ExbD